MMRKKSSTLVKVLVLGVFLIPSLTHYMAKAADTPTSIQVDGLALSTCGNGDFEGSYGITVLNNSGLVLNEETGYDVSAVFSTATDVYNTISFPHRHNVTYSYSIKLDESANTGFVYFYLTDYPSVVSSTYILDCNALTVYPAKEGDDRLNSGQGDLVNALYARVGAEGLWEIHVYSIDETSTGTLSGKFLYKGFVPYLDNPPSQNTRIGQVSYSTLYALTTGEFQIDIDSPTEPKTYSIIFRGVPPRNVYAKLNEH
jgi:hypothetical protein